MDPNAAGATRIPCNDQRCRGHCDSPSGKHFCSPFGGSCEHFEGQDVCTFAWLYGDGSSAQGTFYGRGCAEDRKATVIRRTFYGKEMCRGKEGHYHPRLTDPSGHHPEDTHPCQPSQSVQGLTGCCVLSLCVYLQVCCCRRRSTWAGRGSPARTVASSRPPTPSSRYATLFFNQHPLKFWPLILSLRYADSVFNNIPTVFNTSCYALFRFEPTRLP